MLPQLLCEGLLSEALKVMPHHLTCRNNEATLFVGDLPPSFSADDVEALFSGFAAVAGARVIGAQCYAFVEFESADEAEGVLEQVGQSIC